MVSSADYLSTMLYWVLKVLALDMLGTYSSSDTFSSTSSSLKVTNYDYFFELQEFSQFFILMWILNKI